MRPERTTQNSDSAIHTVPSPMQENEAVARSLIHPFRELLDLLECNVHSGLIKFMIAHDIKDRDQGVRF